MVREALVLLVFNCYECAFKHLSVASRVWVELQNGYGDDVGHISAFLGDLACAAEHLYETQPELASSIRNDRIVLLKEFVDKPGLPPNTRPSFEEYMRVLLEIMQSEKSKQNRR